MCHGSDIDEIEARQELPLADVEEAADADWTTAMGGPGMVALLGELQDIRELLELQLRIQVETAWVQSRNWKLDGERRRNIQELLVSTRLRLKEIAFPEGR